MKIVENIPYRSALQLYGDKIKVRVGVKRRPERATPNHHLRSAPAPNPHRNCNPKLITTLVLHPRLNPGVHPNPREDIVRLLRPAEKQFYSMIASKGVHKLAEASMHPQPWLNCSHVQKLDTATIQLRPRPKDA